MVPGIGTAASIGLDALNASRGSGTSKAKGSGLGKVVAATAVMTGVSSLYASTGSESVSEGENSVPNLKPKTSNRGSEAQTENTAKQSQSNSFSNKADHTQNINESDSTTTNNRSETGKNSPSTQEERGKNRDTEPNTTNPSVLQKKSSSDDSGETSASNTQLTAAIQQLTQSIQSQGQNQNQGNSAQQTTVPVTTQREEANNPLNSSASALQTNSQGVTQTESTQNSNSSDEGEMNNQYAARMKEAFESGSMNNTMKSMEKNSETSRRQAADMAMDFNDIRDFNEDIANQISSVVDRANR